MTVDLVNGCLVACAAEFSAAVRRALVAMAAAIGLLPFRGPAPAAEIVVGGLGNDYQATVVVPWSDAQQRIAVFERLDAGFSGDLWLTRSANGGINWTAAAPVIASGANERHASLLQVAANSFVLFHLSNASGAFRIHRASSADGVSFTPQGAIDLGWASGGEINPQIIRDANGDLLLVYHRLGGAAYIARSTDGGATWDTQRIQVSPGNAALPRLARRATDGRYLLLYQTGSNPVSLWARTSEDAGAWADTPQLLVADGNNHDGWPLAKADGSFLVFWARVADGAFQIHASRSPDGAQWSAPEALTDRPGLANVQPLALPGADPGHVELYWGAAQVVGDSNYDIVREPALVVADALFADGLED